MDRNDNGNPVAVSDLESLSARRAWIETRMVLFPALVIMVALRKESVDRNRGISSGIAETASRSPQGERG